MAASQRAASTSGARPGAGASSNTFCCRRCIEQSRVPSAHTCPWVSARICTSTWRASATNASTNTEASPKAAAASVAAARSASASSAGDPTRLMPRPPPPAAALSRIG